MLIILQLCLHELGLSTLGTVESHTLHALDAGARTRG